MLWSTAYLASVVGVNAAFQALPMVQTPIGDWPPAAILAGAVFVLRDFAQREVGHAVVILMLLGTALTWWLVDPFLAVASCAAFLLSEAVDWGVYTLSRQPFARRVVISSAVSTPLDSAAFLLLAGFWSPAAFVAMTASKMAVALPFVLKRQDATAC